MELILTIVLHVSWLATSPNAGSELEQARPQTSGEEELQLQLALAMSREAAEQVQTQTRGNMLLFFCTVLCTLWHTICCAKTCPEIMLII